MKTYNISKLSKVRLKELTKRSYIETQLLKEKVLPLINEVKKDGLKAALKYAGIFDGFNNNNLLVTDEEYNSAVDELDESVIKAIETAFSNIYNFHIRQKPEGYSLETMPGVLCERIIRPIENVALYIPGGNTVLPSTLMMLGIPAKIAGCKRVVAVTPSKNGKIHPALLYIAGKLGIKEFYKIGGVQAVALLAFGDKTVKKVDKIFGPGNSYVTAAKQIISNDPDGCAIDMPAGPSEVLIIADKNANPAYVAADFLSQAEHGSDSQSVLISDDADIISETKKEIKRQMKNLKNLRLIKESLSKSFMMKVNNIDEAIEFSNDYAPEHLILNIKNYREVLKQIVNAGSVFIGNYSPESAGDYASGTNHSLPTYGYAKAYSGVKVEDFVKTITTQRLTKKGLCNLSESIIKLAEIEKLDAHAAAVKLRIGK